MKIFNRGKKQAAAAAELEIERRDAHIAKTIARQDGYRKGLLDGRASQEEAFWESLDADPSIIDSHGIQIEVSVLTVPYWRFSIGDNVIDVPKQKGDSYLHGMKRVVQVSENLKIFLSRMEAAAA